MTLVELMVALSLGVILIGVVTFVWMQSNKIFTTTVNKLEIYQRLRTVLDVMERDLANTNRTVDMELYLDVDPDLGGPLKSNGHYDESDTVLASPTVTGRDFRAPQDPGDPLNNKDEFGVIDSSGANPFKDFPLQYGQTDAFLFAGSVLSPEPYEINDEGYTTSRFYWRDEVYVGTYTMVDGLNRPALVHYRLVQTADQRSVLRRRLWFLNENRELVFPGSETNPPTDRTTILSHGIVDLKVAFYFKESTSQEAGGTSGVGRWYHIGNTDEDWSAQGKALRDIDEQRGMLSARGTKALSQQHQDQFEGGMNAVSFAFKGAARLEDMLGGGVVLRGLRDLASGESLNDLDITDLSVYDQTAQFPGVRPGDHFYVYDASDDDGSQSIGEDIEAGEHFPDQLLTVSFIYTDRNPADKKDWAAVKFDEPIDFFSLGRGWLGRDVAGELPQTIGDPSTDTFDTQAGPGRVINQSFNVSYRVGFLPAAFLIRLSCDDRQNRNLVQMERVIRLLQQ